MIISPNPSNGVFDIEMSAKELSKDFDIYIYDITGSQICSFQNPLRKTQIDISDLPNGIYFIILHSKNKELSKKLIISR